MPLAYLRFIKMALPRWEWTPCWDWISLKRSNRIAEAVRPISTRQTSLQAVVPSAGTFKMATIFFKRTRNRTKKPAQISVWTSKMETPYLELRLLCNLPGFTFYASYARMRCKPHSAFTRTSLMFPWYKEEPLDASKDADIHALLGVVSVSALAGGFVEFPKILKTPFVCRMVPAFAKCE